ncbi:MAG: phosphotransferase [Caldilineaceae bacterium]
MMADFLYRLNSVDTRVLTPVVRQALRDDEAQVLNWNTLTLPGGMAQEHGASLGLYRFQGKALSHAQERPWSIILKVLAAAVTATSPIASTDPSSCFYWKREVMVYQSGLLSDLPGGLYAPRCFGITEHAGEEYWIWLEDVTDRTWSRADSGLAAHRLGQFNGAYLCGRPMPQAGWLAKEPVRTWLELGSTGILDIEHLRRHPVNQRWLDDETVARVQRLWAQQERLLTALAGLPCTFCHNDAYRDNLMLREAEDGNTELVAVDWASPGIDCVGAEMAAMVGNAATMYAIPAAEMKDFEAAAMSSYLAGLRDAGWHGAPQQVRFGFAASAALHQGLGLAGLLLILFTNAEEIAIHERFFGRPIEDLLAQRVGYQRYLLDLGDEALSFLDEQAAVNGR